MFLLSYFRFDAEALHLALSDDGLQWRPLRGGAALYWSPVGTRTLRDPFLCRAADGRFHLLSSDGWGSRSIVHAVSDDLIRWRDAALVPVMGEFPQARNAWAPEAFWDREASAWRLVWSSSVTEANTPSDFNLRIWSCVTTDFKTFSASALFFDPGYSVIDACVVEHEGRYAMAFKDERGQNPPHHQGPNQRKAIAVAFADLALGPWSGSDELVSPPLTEGPTLFRRDGQWIMAFDHFIDNHYGALASADGQRWEPVATPVSFPPGARHASVLEISDETANNLLSEYS